MVNLTRIYTRTGDAGTTRLGDMSETSKNDLRLAAYADVDEANAQIGVALAQGDLAPDVVAVLTHVQNDLFDVGADFSTPVVEKPAAPAAPRRAGLRRPPRGLVRPLQRRPAEPAVVRAERRHTGAALLHVARTVVRRAERSAWAAYAEHADTMNVRAITYLNRLSDLLFILARHANKEQGDVLWIPGGDRT